MIFKFKSTWNIVYAASVKGYIVEINNTSRYFKIYTSSISGGDYWKWKIDFESPRLTGTDITFNVLYS